MLAVQLIIVGVRLTFGGDMSDINYPKGLATVLPDDNTQEPIQAWFTPPHKRHHNAKWLLLWQGETEIEMSIQDQAKMQKPLTQTEYRVRDWLIGEIGIGNYVYVNQAEVARQLRLYRPDVSTAIKRLISLNILIPGPKSGRSNTYMVNPAFCFAGGLGHGIQERNRMIKNSKAKVHEFSKADES